jgi:beta-fructofuranosidase
MGIFYRPDDGVAADFIPFFWRGEYHLFYLKDYRDIPGHGEGTPYWHIVTRDFVHFEDWGEALARGPQDAQDLMVSTGCVLEHEGTFHIFYTGQNHHFSAIGRPTQGGMHATSRDLRTWAKEDEPIFYAPTDRYEKDDWRDPFVFWNPEAGEYWMLLAARVKMGPSRLRGCTALAASRDLVHWEMRPTFWAPDLYYTHECPDLFRIGEWWYLVYSTFSERSVTHYRMSRSLEGPWLAPANDTFDGRAFYAAKSASVGAAKSASSDDGRRYMFGWLPTREGETDTGKWQWGGELVVHEVVQRADGMLAVRPPDTVLAAFNHALAPGAPHTILGSWRTEDDGSLATSAVGRNAIISLGAMPDECLLEMHVTYEAGTASYGLLLRADATYDAYYQVRLEPANQRMVIDRWPRPGDEPFMLERPFALKKGQSVTLKVITSGTNQVVYAGATDRQGCGSSDEQEWTALSCRMYDHRSGEWGLFVIEGQARFAALQVKGRA